MLTEAGPEDDSVHHLVVRLVAGKPYSSLCGSLAGWQRCFRSLVSRRARRVGGIEGATTATTGRERAWMWLRMHRGN